MEGTPRNVGVLVEMDAGIERRLHTGRRLRGRPAPAALGDISDREHAVLRLLPTDLSQRQIGDELFVSHNTVKTHVKSILRKLDASSREEAVTRARERGLL